MMKNYLSLLLLLLVSTGFVSAADLKDEGGYHFKFSGTKYTFIMTTKGNFEFYSADKSKDLNNLNPEDGFKMNYLIKSQSGNGPADYQSIETQKKQSSSSFQLIVKLVTDTGVKSTLVFKGDKRQMIVSVDNKLPDDYSNSIGFSFSECPPEFQKGLVSTLTTNKKVLKHPCFNPYDVKNQKLGFRQIDIRERLGMNVNFDIKSSKGKLSILQISHNKGASLNKEFRITYGNKSTPWPMKDNTIVLKFS